jgi:hypothetical protein
MILIKASSINLLLIKVKKGFLIIWMGSSFFIFLALLNLPVDFRSSGGPGNLLGTITPCGVAPAP